MAQDSFDDAFEKLVKKDQKNAIDGLSFIRDNFDEIFAPMPGSFTKENINGAINLIKKDQDDLNKIR